ncbi:hypothetical protein MMC20_003118 [Loxospora ochrophaea]|nr:hypothetical protein [Loxospora ochrophaea]
MAHDSKIREFPDIGTKLTAPTKKSLFERQKAEAEAKRLREQQETAAVYEDFVKSFDDADEDGPGPRAPGRLGNHDGAAGPGGFGGPSKRHFTGPPTGPGGRGGLGSRGHSGPGSLGPPPPSLSRKRGLDGSQVSQRDSNHGLFAFEDANAGPIDAKVAFQNSDDEEEKSGYSKAHERAAPKPTLHLSSLPPGTSPAVIKSVLPTSLGIDSVRILPPTGPGTTERRSLSAIVTLAKDTPYVDIDTAVSALQNRYLGWGFYLSISRHLSSAAVGTGLPAPVSASSATSSLPFGARPIPTGPGGGLSRAPPPGSLRGGFAPPSSYGPTQYGRGPPPVQVNVVPPSDLRQLKLIHKTLESLLTHGPEFEALLMSRYEVQKDEKWAWMWDPRSVGGVWYRWRLWDVLTRARRSTSYRRSGNSGLDQQVFEGGASWAGPEKDLPYEYVTKLEEFVSDSEYDSSEEEDSGDEGRRRYEHYHGGAPPPDISNATTEGDGQSYLNPLQKAKLTHLLARLPNTNAKLRRGDVARVTAFAIQHAGEGAEEVVDMITSNVQKPYAFSTANASWKAPVDDVGLKDDDEGLDEDRKNAEKEDSSPSKLIALYIISDILSSSSTSGVRHAWRYRQLFEGALKQKKIFEGLGRLEKDMHWGRLRAEKWKRSVSSVLGLWEGWCVFPQASQEHFATVFANPPLTAAEEAANVAAEKASIATFAAKSRWKTIEEKAQSVESSRRDIETVRPSEAIEQADFDVDGEPMGDEIEDIDDEAMDEDGDIDGEPMEDVDGEGMAEEGDEITRTSDSDRRTAMAGDGNAKAKTEINKSAEFDQEPTTGFKMGSGTAPNSKETLSQSGRRRRPKAEDMFADSDDE